MSTLAERLTGDEKRQISQCVYCIHWIQGRCTAFPKGVPMDILTNQFDHRKPHEGDGGILFEANPDGMSLPDWLKKEPK